MKQLVIETHNGSVSVEVHDQYGSIVNGKLYHSNESIINKYDWVFSLPEYKEVINVHNGVKTVVYWVHVADKPKGPAIELPTPTEVKQRKLNAKKEALIKAKNKRVEEYARIIAQGGQLDFDNDEYMREGAELQAMIGRKPKGIDKLFTEDQIDYLING